MTMTSTLPPHPFAQVLQDAQVAPDFLQRNPAQQPTFPLSLLSGQTESTELWNTYEKLLISCLQSGDEKSANGCLERLIARFGVSNERVMALRGVYEEAIAKSPRDLERILHEYEKTLAADPVNIPVAKRRIALLQGLERQADAIKALVELLDFSPSDAEAWMELAELYFTVGLYDRAVFCLEEVLLIAPNAWNTHARLGEVLYISAVAETSKDNAEMTELLHNSVQRFCRSIELCDNYLRGYYGLKLATDALFQRTTTNSIRLSAKTIKDLNDKATGVLRQIIDQKNSGYSDEELAATRRLLERS